MKTSRKIFRWFTVFAMFLILMAPVFAAEDYGITWELSDDGILTVTGAGELNAAPWESQAEKIKKVIIGEGITRIGKDAFFSCSNLEEVVIPESVVKIDGFAFRSPALKQVFLPAGVKEIDHSSFRSCKNLERIDVSPDNLCFASDSFGVVYTKDMTMLLIAPAGLTGSYTIPGNVQSVGGVYEYTYPVGIGLSDQMMEVEYSAFYGCEKLTQIQICEGVKFIGFQAFRLCDGLTEVTIPDSVFKLDDYAFQNCDGLEKVHIGAGVKRIGRYCFAELDRLKEITVPGNVRTIDDHAFGDIKSLEKVVLENGISQIGNSAFISCFNLQELQLPGTLSTISNSAFRNCEKLVNVIIPARVQSIERLAFDGINDMKKVTFEGGAPKLAADAFEDRKIEFCYPEGNETWEPLVGTNAGTRTRIQWSSYQKEAAPDTSVYLIATGFSEDPATEKYTEYELWSDGLLTMRGTGVTHGYGGSYADLVTKLVIEEEFGALGLEARFSCPNLEEVVFQSHIGRLSLGLFADCSRLKKVTFFGSAPVFEAYAMPQKDIVFLYPEGDASWEPLVDTNVSQRSRITWVSFQSETEPEAPEVPEIPAHGTITGGDETAYGAIQWTLYDDGLLEISGTISPHESYFRGVAHLIRKAVIGDGCTVLDFNSFKDCPNLTEVVLPKTLQRIKGNCFVNCPGLERIFIPAGVIELNSLAFETCGNLKFIEVEPGNANYTSDASGVVFNKEMTMLLMAPRGLQGSYTVPDTVTSVGGAITYQFEPHLVTTIDYTGFYGCEKLTEVVLLDGLETIAAGAFQNCKTLKTVNLPDSLRNIGHAAFKNCTKLKELHIPGVRIIASECFAGCGSLERAVLEEGVEEIQDGAFKDCLTLREVVLPDSLTVIGAGAFLNSNLFSVTIPAKVAEIQSDAFSNGRMTHMVFRGDPPKMNFTVRLNFVYAYPQENEAWLPVVEKYKDHYVQNYWTPYCTETVAGQASPRYVVDRGTGENGITWVLEANGTLTVSGTGAIGSPAPWAGLEQYLLRVVVEDGITAIPEGAFQGFDRLGSAYLAASLESVGVSAFANCTSLEKLEFAGTLPRLGENCFENVIGVLCHDAADGSWNEAILKATGGSFILVSVTFPERPETPEQPEIPGQPQGVPGDVDGNGKLDYKDALIILRASIKLETLTEAQSALADYSGDGKLDYKDALMILRASIGLEN